MDDPTRSAIEKLHDSPVMAAFVVAGAGSDAVSDLLGVPGASHTMLEAVIPYGWRAMVEYLGWEPEQYVSEQTAISLAAAAYVRARRFRLGESTHTIDTSGPTLGVSCTATVVTDRPKRGEHRCHIGVWNGQQVTITSLVLVKDLRDRQGEEHLVSQLVLRALCDVAGIDSGIEVELAEGEHVEVQHISTVDPLDRLLSKEVEKMTFYGQGVLVPDEPIQGAAILPGSFNPLHHAHVHLARIAARRLDRPLLYEIAAHNVDKPPLSRQEIRERLEQFDGEKRRVVLTVAPLYWQKAQLFPNSVFVVGYDTASRIVDPKYYDGSREKMLGALDIIREMGCSFLVAGRLSGGEFCWLADLNVPPGYEPMFSGLRESAFRVDISSTELRESGFHVDYD